MRPKLVPILFLLVTALAYFPAFSAGFIWDDPDYIINNANLRSLQGLLDTWLKPYSLPQYYPLVHTTFWLEYQLWGLWAPGYHAVNVLLHAAGGYLLYRLLLRVPISPRVSLLAALLWTLHPVQVESVAWVTERKNTLSALFYFLSFLALLNWWDSHNRPARWLSLAGIAYVAALASKTVTASLPAAFLLVLWYRDGAVPAARRLWALTPFFAVGLAAGLFTAHLERTHVVAAGPEWNFSPGDRVLIAGRAIWFYLGKLALPIDLAFIYPRWQLDTASLLQWLYPLAAAGGLLGLFLLRGRLGRAPLAASLFFVGTLFPALGFFNIYPQRYSFVADHFQHLACIGPLALVAAALARAPRAIPALVLLICGVLSALQATIYRDPLTLWTDTAAKNPASWMVQVNLGLTHDQLATASPAASDPAARAFHERQAYEHMLRAAELGPTIAEAQWNAGVAHANRGEFPQAQAAFDRAIRLDPADPRAFNSLGLVLLRQGDLARAESLLARAIELQPKFPAAHANLGQLYARQGRLDPAARQYAAALSLDPDRPAWRLALARVVTHLALSTEDPTRRRELLAAAVGHYTLAARLSPADPRPRWELARATDLASPGSPAAQSLLAQALRADPRLADAPFPPPLADPRPATAP